MVQKEFSNQYEVELHQQILKVCHKLELNLHDNHKGPKIYANYQRVALIVLFTRSRKALRDFCSELVESKWPSWLGLKDLPTKSTLHRWISKFDLMFVRKILRRLVKKKQPRIMAVDATGFDSFHRSRHYEKRLKQCGFRKPYEPYAKADILVDTETKFVYDFVLRTKPRHDVLGAETIFKRLEFLPDVILGDKGYDSENLHEILFQKNILFHAPVRDFKVKKPKGKHRRRCLEPHPDKGMRSIVESVIRSLKVRLRNLRSKHHWMKKRELGWHIITYNLEKLSKQAKACLILLLRAITIWDRAFNLYYHVFNSGFFPPSVVVCIN